MHRRNSRRVLCAGICAPRPCVRRVRRPFAQPAPIVALVLGSLIGLAVFHILLREFFVSGLRQVELTFPSQMAALANTADHFADISGYPATVQVGGSDSPPTAIFKRARVCPGDAVGVVKTTFDPLRFFDIALRVLPPDFVASQQELFTRQMSASRSYLAAERTVDVALALVMLVVSSPLCIIVAVGVIVSDGRPMFFS